MTVLQPRGNQRTAVIVLGMHRSGTSAMAGVLSLLGIAVPRHLMVPTEDNPKGYWESTALMTVHDRILRSAGSSWHDWDQFNPAWIDSPAAPPLLAQLQEAISSEFDDAPTLLVKDPRMCRLMPVWRRVLERMGIDARVVMPLRKPVEVSLSLQARNGFGALQAQALWLRHVLEAEAGSRGLARSVVTYDALLHDWRDVVARLGRELRLAWPRWSGAVEAELDAYLSDELHRNRRDDDELRPTGRPQDAWVRETYALLTGAPGPDTSEVRTRLDALMREFDSACHAYMPVLHEIEGRLEADRNALKGQLAESRRELEAAASTQAQALARIDDLTRQLAEMEQARAADAQAREADAQAQRTAEAAHAQRLVEEKARAARRLVEVEVRGAQRLAEEETRAAQALAALETERARSAGLQEQLQLAGEAASDAEQRHADELDAVRAARKAEAEGWRVQLAEANASVGARFDETRILTELVFSLEAEVASLSQRAAALEGRLAAVRQAHDLESTALHAALEAQRATIERFNRWSNTVLAGRTLKTARMLSGAPREMLVPSLAKLDGVPDLQLLRQSRYFHEAWYLHRYPDVAGRKMDPVKHYLRYGAREGRDPSPAFSTRGYLGRYPDVTASGLNPLVHYLRHGMQEGRIATRDTGTLTP